jgi:hypothetical protein
MITFSVIFGLCVLVCLCSILITEYKKRYNRNFFFNTTTFVFIVSEIFMVLSESINLDGTKTEFTNFVMNDTVPGMFVFGIVLAILCLVVNIVRSNILWGIFQSIFQIILVTILNVFLVIGIMSSNDNRG